MARPKKNGTYLNVCIDILGEWIRKKIGAPSGGYVTKQMLEHYGKTYVRFRKYAEGIYLLDL